MNRAGTPPCRTLLSQSDVTTAPAATTAPSPITTPGSTIAPAPIQTPLPTVIGAAASFPARRLGPSSWWEPVRRSTRIAMSQLCPMETGAELSTMHPSLIKVPEPIRTREPPKKTPDPIRQRPKSIPNIRSRRHRAARGTKVEPIRRFMARFFQKFGQSRPMTVIFSGYPTSRSGVDSIAIP